MRVREIRLLIKRLFECRVSFHLLNFVVREVKRVASLDSPCTGGMLHFLPFSRSCTDEYPLHKRPWTSTTRPIANHFLTRTSRRSVERLTHYTYLSSRYPFQLVKSGLGQDRVVRLKFYSRDLYSLDSRLWNLALPIGKRVQACPLLWIVTRRCLVSGWCGLEANDL